MTRLEFKVTLPPADAVAVHLDAQRHALGVRLRKATETATRALVLDPLRAQVKAALKSRKLPTTWRARIYPTNAGSGSLDPAGFVWSQTPELMLAFDQGAVIRPVAGKRYLWIPTENVASGRGGSRAKPAETARRVGPFAFAKAKNGSIVAYARVGRRSGARRRSKNAARSPAPPKSRFVKPTRADRAAGKVEAIAFYILVRQITLKKRLDIAAVVKSAQTAFPAALAAAALGK